MTIGRAAFTTRLARPVDLLASWNASDSDVAGRLHPLYAQALGRLPEGDAVFRGVPFSLGTRAATRRWIVVGDGVSVQLPEPGPASHLLIAHFADSWRDPSGARPAGMPVGWVLPAGEPLVRYELVFAGGRTQVVDVRRRFEIADGIIGWGYLPFEAVGHHADEVIDWRGPYPRQEPGRIAPAGHAGPLTTLPGTWSAAQSGAVDFVPSATDDVSLWLHAIALEGDEAPIELRLAPLGEGRPGTDVVIAGLTLFNGTANPLVATPRREILVTGAGAGPGAGLPGVDLGIAIRARPLQAARDVADRGAPIGWGRALADAPVAVASSGGSIIDFAAAADAWLTFGDWEVAVTELPGNATSASVSPDGRTSIRQLPRPDVRVNVRITSAGETTPTPARVRFVSADGRYLPPLGHRDEINPGIFEDTGAGLILGSDTFAYVPGEFQIDLPVGSVELEVVKGFDHLPVRTAVSVAPGAADVSIELERPIDLQAAGWRTSDSHVHFLAPSTALLQAAAEDLTFVHLLATQLGDYFINVPDLPFGSQQDPSGRHAVIVGTENRQNMLGHLALLGARRPVAPFASGGAPEGRIGQAISELLGDWADQCHAAGGLVVGAHFPLPFAEIAADIVAGQIDALEMQVFAPGLDNPCIQEWYRFLNCGYRLPVLGGTDKMSAEVPVGAVRTYARLDPDAAPTFEAWSAAVRAGRTFATSGPVIELAVDGHEPGDVLDLPASGGSLPVQVHARAAQPVISAVELVVNGRVVTRETASEPTTDLWLAAIVEVREGSWIAARSLSDQQIHSAFTTSMAAHTSPVYVEVLDHPLFVVKDAQAIMAVIDGTVRWLETMAAIDDPAVRAGMAARIAASGTTLRGRLGH